jgi:hypothetical protein
MLEDHLNEFGTADKPKVGFATLDFHLRKG